MNLALTTGRGYCQRIVTELSAQRPVVLVVDDDADIREALIQVLESEGWPVESAANGREALDRLDASPDRFGLVLLDLMMPVLSGWEFMVERARNPQLERIPVLVITASTHANPVVGASGFLSKPLNLDRLLELVERTARRTRS